MVNKGREKELDRDMSDTKKHRKAITTTTSNDGPEIKLPKEDVYAVSTAMTAHKLLSDCQIH